MFTTLRYNTDTALRVTSAKSAHQKLKRRACKDCHSKKLRCTREEDGCRRCLSRSIKCEYERESHRRTRRSGSSAGQSTTNDPASRTTLVEDRLITATSGTQPPGYTVTTPSDRNNISSSSFTVDSNLVFDFLDYDLGDSVNGFSTSDMLSRVSATGSPANGVCAQPITGGSPREEPPTHQLSDPLLFFEAASQSAVTNSQMMITPPMATRSPSMESNPSTSCQCGASAISLLETVSIEYIEATLLSVPRVICRSKPALSQCRKLLSCNRCSNTSEFLMLLIIICEKVTSVYQRTIIILTEQFHKLYPPNRKDEVHMAGLDMATARDADRSLNLREYDVEVEEEPCVFGGVIQMQLKKVIAFLAILKAVLGDE
ncbi:hypothetical protein V1506DRAFT_43085 [Lipomyces tetrasporus]